MNYNSVIKPDAMISQCNEMLLMFEQDNDSIQTVWNAFNQFIDDSEIKSEAFDALKQRVSDYLTVLQSMKIANEMDMEDCRSFARLMEAVGTNIIGSDVLDGKEAAKQDMLDHDALADKNAAKAKTAGKPMKWYYECQKKYYEMLAENDEDIYNERKRIEQTYDEADAASAKYFVRGNQVRAAVEPALQELKQLSAGNSSTSMNSLYRNTLQGICTVYQDAFDKGNISEKEKYQIKSWLATDYKLSDEELEIAKEYIDQYFKENKQAKRLLDSRTATEAAVVRNKMSVEEFNEYQMMAALYNKTSKWNGFWLGVTDAIPFLTEAIDWSDNLVCEMEDKQVVKNATLSSIMENAKLQNPVAYGSGYAASLVAQAEAVKGLTAPVEEAGVVEGLEGIESGSKAIDTSKYTELSNAEVVDILKTRGLDEEAINDLLTSFDGPIYKRIGYEGETFTITESKVGDASGVFVTRGSAGSTPTERINNLALPPNNSALIESQVELTRNQILLEGKVAPQKEWALIANDGIPRTGGAWQVVTDGGKYSNSIRR